MKVISVYWFCILWLLNSLISSSNFLIVSLGFSMSSIMSFVRTDAEAETPRLWLPHAKSWLIGKDSDTERDWGQKEKGTTEDEMAGWHHRLNGHEFEWTLGVGDGQGGLACCDSWGHKESDTTEWLNWTELNHKWVLNFVKGFFCIYWDYHMDLPFNLLIWCITLIDFHILKNPCIPGINPTWS